MQAPGESKGEVFCQKDIEQLKKISDLYTQVKGLILYSEEIDPTARSNIQVIKELRDANDHLMRVFTARLSDTPPAAATEPDYCDKNIDKAIGHVYRAAFDSLDGTVLSLREKISQILQAYPQHVIKEVISDYWDLRTKLDALTQNVAQHRATKDVAGNVAETLNLYVKDAEQVKEFYKRVVAAGPALDECHEHHKQKEKNENMAHLGVHIVGGLIYTAIGGLFAVLIGYWIKPNFLQKPTPEPVAAEAVAASPISDANAAPLKANGVAKNSAQDKTLSR